MSAGRRRRGEIERAVSGDTVAISAVAPKGKGRQDGEQLLIPASTRFMTPGKVPGGGCRPAEPGAAVRRNGAGLRASRRMQGGQGIKRLTAAELPLTRCLALLQPDGKLLHIG